MAREIKFFLYDARWHVDSDAAICFEVCDDIDEAMENKDDYGDDTVIVKATIENNVVISQVPILDGKEN